MQSKYIEIEQLVKISRITYKRRRPILDKIHIKRSEPGNSTSYKIPRASSGNADQLAHLHSLIGVFAVSMKTLWIFGYLQSALRRRWSDCADVQADLSLSREHMQSCRKCCAPVHIVDFTLESFDISHNTCTCHNLFWSRQVLAHFSFHPTLRYCRQLKENRYTSRKTTL